MTKDEALKLALEALEFDSHYGTGKQEAITALREALAEQPAQQLVDCHVTGVCVQSGLRAEQPAQPEPCGWQFFQDGKWHNGMDVNDHRRHTEAAGFPVRDVYPSPQRAPVIQKSCKQCAHQYHYEQMTGPCGPCRFYSNFALAPQPAQQEPVAVHQFRNRYVTDWYDGAPDHQDGHGPYEVRTLYTAPPKEKNT